MALEDLNVKISMDLADAPAALAQLGKIQGVVDMVSANAAKAEFNVRAFGTALQTAGLAARPLALVGSEMTVIASSVRLAASGVSVLAAGFGILHTMAVYLSAGIGFLLLPLHGLVMLPKLIMASFSAMFAVILTPFKVLIGLISMTFRGIMTLLSPVIAIAKAFFMLKMGLHAIGLQFQILWKIMAVLPPQLRVLVAGLVALGAAGRAGRVAMNVLTLGIRAVTFAALAATKPFQAMGVAALAAGKALAGLAVRSISAAMSLVTLSKAAMMAAMSGLKSLAAAGLSAAQSIGTRLYSAASSAVSIMGVLGAATVGWGMKTAIGLETAETIFGVLLKDMEQGKALMASLNATKVAPFFDSKQIQDAGRDIIKAGVPVTQVTSKLEQLGQMAVATKTPIDELSRIYRQGMARGAFQTDLVNQMAERGIDIYHALTAVTGMQGEALAKAMSDGKIGADQMNAAIEHLTTGHGIYAGAVEAVGQTTGGMFSRMVNNVQQALGAMFSGGNTAFGQLLRSAVVMTEGFKTSFVQLSPVVVQVMGVFTDAFMGVWQVSSAVFAAIFGAGQATFGGLIAIGMDWATKFRWFFQNFGQIAQFAFVQMQLFAVTAFNDIIYFFTDKMPAYLSWFSQNWRQVFTDAGNLIVTVFSNIATNIGNAMRAIWDFISSGGTAELKFAFVPLLDGFKATVAELPNIPERAMTQLETDLTNKMQGIGTKLADNFDKLNADATASLNVVAPKVELKDGESAGTTLANGITQANKKAVENKAVGVRSSEGQSLVAQFMTGLKPDALEKKAQQAAVDTAKDIHDVARLVKAGKPIATRSFARG